MKFIVLLLALIAITQCADIPETNGFELIGVYNVSNDCNVFQCPNTLISGQEFVCPLNGTGNAQITFNSGSYNLELRTQSEFSTGGYVQQYFTQNNIRGNEQIQIELGAGYTLNMQICINGQQTSYLCPVDQYWNDKAMVAWKSFNGQVVEGCNFLMMHQ